MIRRPAPARFPRLTSGVARRLTKGVLGVAVFGLMSTLALGWAEARVADALGERALGFGGELYHASLFARLGKVGFDSSEEISLNGARIRIETTHEALPESSQTNPFLERVRKECATPHEETSPGEKQRSAAQKGQGLPLLPSPAVQKETRDQGVLFCLKPRMALTRWGIEQLIRSFGRSGDLTQMGTFHGVYTRTEGTQMAVLSIETLGPLDPAHMFPATGDAPGSDLSEVPRPSGRRLLSIAHRGTTALTAYESTDAPEAALGDLERQAKDRHVAVSRAKAGATALVMRTPGDAFVVTAKSNEGRTIVTMARLPK